MRLSTTFNIECAHTIEEPVGVPVLHGHSYLITVSVGTSPEAPAPLPELQRFAGMVQSRLDHRHLNDLLAGRSTMEAIISFVRLAWPGPQLVGVKVERPTIGASAEWSA
ncbi:MAG TPA: 6-carboxytetrahydropterin synthase [Usitatibacter sp.]|nr:6-carboxytetrahydropterin synthase [Usitatibacter sp.]